MITENERKESDEQPIPSVNVELYMVEHLAEVNWKGNSIPELIRKHALRKLLSLLLEHSAEGAEKETIASVVWGETYRPDIHDARIYTSIQRLRILFKTNSCIQSWNGGYCWNPQFKFQLLRYQVKQKVAASNNRCQNLILQALERFSQSGKNSIARTELVSITKSSEATVKRELAKLLSSAKILRMGKGRAVSYCLKNSSGVMA